MPRTGRIEIVAPERTLRGVPANLWALRWRLKTTGNLVVVSSWLPETRYPCLAETLAEFAGRIEAVAIDGKSLYEDTKTTFLTCPGDSFQALSYKAFGSFAAGRDVVGGIELAAVSGDRYLVLRDGTVHVEEGGV